MKLNENVRQYDGVKLGDMPISRAIKEANRRIDFNNTKVREIGRNNPKAQSLMSECTGLLRLIQVANNYKELKHEYEMMKLDFEKLKSELNANEQLDKIELLDLIRQEP